MAQVSLAPEVVAIVGNFKITNSLLATLLVDIILLTLVIYIRTNLSSIPSKIQLIAEGTIEYFHTLTEQIAGKFANVIFPWFATFFIFIFFSNILGLLPGFGSVGFFHNEKGREVFVPILRAATSDFNTTFGLATVSLVATHFLAIKYNGIINYLKRFFSLNPIFLFVGVLLISLNNAQSKVVLTYNSKKSAEYIFRVKDIAVFLFGLSLIVYFLIQLVPFLSQLTQMYAPTFSPTLLVIALASGIKVVLGR